MDINRNRINSKRLLESIQQDEILLKDCEILPANYNLEVAKTIWKIRLTESKKVALQFPEGLLLYSCMICNILRRHTDVDVIIMGDITYGACCIDEYTAKELGCDMLVHYGHSCLIPIQDTPNINMLYIFVDIHVNTQHFVDTIRNNFDIGKTLALVSTIQFVKSIHAAACSLENCDSKNEAAGSKTYKIIIPQTKPLSPGEILGCTSPRLSGDIDALIYLGDGRFHLESMMIHNPKIPAYQYDPYSKEFTREEYDHNEMLRSRKQTINIARNARTFGLILGTLGHQGNMKIFDRIEKLITQNGREYINVLMSEIFPQKLSRFSNVDCWVQVACPRLSIDWSSAFEKPLITPFELNVALKIVDLGDVYPMDYYSNDSLGPWTNNHEANRTNRVQRTHNK